MYFQGANVLSLIVSGLITSVFCFIFLSAGRLSIFKNVKLKRALSVLYGIGGMAVSAVMLSCIREVFYLDGFAVIILCSMLCMSLALNSSKGVTLFTGASVPIIILCCLIVSIKCNSGLKGGAFNLSNSVKYSAMNMFFQCAFITKEGENISLKESILTSIIVGVTITLLLIPMYSIVRESISSIPFLDRASNQGLSFIAIVEILFAVLTTITSCYSLSLGMFDNKHIIWVLLTIVISVSLSSFDFSKFVSVVYPVISYIGLLLFACAALGLIVYFFNEIRNNKCHRRYG